AEELDAAVADATQPAGISFDQGWLDRDGRMKIFDGPLDEIAPRERAAENDLKTPAFRAKGVLRRANEDGARGPALPVFVSSFLEELKHRPNDAATLAWCVGQLRAAATRPAVIRWYDRLVSMGVSSGTEYTVFTVVLALVSLGLIWIDVLPSPMIVVLVTLTAIILPFAVGFWTKGGPVFRLTGIAVRRAAGSAPSRFRCGTRNLMSWFLPLLAGVLNIAMMPIFAKDHRAPPGPPGKMNPEAMNLALIMMGLGCGYLFFMMLQGIGMILAVVFPQRGPQDVVAG